MKIYKPKPDEVIRVIVSQAKAKTERITLDDTTVQEAFLVLRELMYNEGIPFKEGNKTTIMVRRCIGGENYESKTFSLYGVTPQKVMEVFNSYLETLEDGE